MGFWGGKEMILLIKFVFFILSMAGYMALLTRKCNLRLEFAPVVCCGMISNVLFAAGILNCMREVSLLIYFGGFVFLAIFSLDLLKNVSKEALSKRNLLLSGIFLLVLVYFSWLLRGSRLVDYDNFSHWGIVVKDMLINNRMPNFSDSVVRFQAYPLGSSLFIYYVCVALGNTEACYLWGQMFMLVSCVFSLAAFVKKANWWCSIIVFMYGVYAFTYGWGNSMFSLLVDILLPLVGVATIAIIFYYREEPWKMIACASILFVFLVNIKNSGVFFYLVCLVYAMAYGKSYIRKNWKSSLLALLAFPLVAMFIWHKHVVLVFASGDTSKHAMSLDNYSKVLAGKSAGEIRDIIVGVCQRFFDLESQSMRLCILVALIAFIALISIQKTKSTERQRVVTRALSLWWILIVWQLGLIVMYVFSMPNYEASMLASYGRYDASAVIFVYGILGIYVINDIKMFLCQGANARYIKISFLAVAFLLPVFLKHDSFSALYTRQDFPASERYVLTCLIDEYDIPSGRSYAIYSNDTVGFYYYLALYEFMTANVVSFNDYDESSLLDSLDGREYLIVIDRGLEIRDSLLKLGYQCPERESFAIDLSSRSR